MNLQNYLRARAIRVHKSHPLDSTIVKEWKYSSFESLILCKGKEYTQVAECQDYIGIPKFCYANCLNLVSIFDDLTYVEGFVIPNLGDVVPSSCVFAIPHAWLINTMGEVLEPTLETPAVEYFGVSFNTKWLRDFIDKRTEEGIDDCSVFEGNFNEKFSLLKFGLPPESRP